MMTREQFAHRVDSVCDRFEHNILSEGQPESYAIRHWARGISHILIEAIVDGIERPPPPASAPVTVTADYLLEAERAAHKKTKRRLKKWRERAERAESEALKSREKADYPSLLGDLEYERHQRSQLDIAYKRARGERDKADAHVTILKEAARAVDNAWTKDDTAELSVAMMSLSNAVEVVEK